MASIPRNPKQVPIDESGMPPKPTPTAVPVRIIRFNPSAIYTLADFKRQIDPNIDELPSTELKANPS